MAVTVQPDANTLADRLRSAIMGGDEDSHWCNDCHADNPTRLEHHAPDCVIHEIGPLVARCEEAEKERDEAKAAVGGPLYREWSQTWVEWLRGIIFTHVGTDAENVDPEGWAGTEGCLDCPHPERCAANGKCEIGTAALAASGPDTPEDA